MIKRTLLTSVFLFVPLVASWAEDTLVIGPEQSLTEKNLPLVYEVMDGVYRDAVLKQGCRNTKSIFEEFIDGNMTVPFSARDLLDLCKRISRTDDFVGLGDDCQTKHCPHFVLRYIQDIAEYQRIEKVVLDGVPFDEEKFKLLSSDYDNCKFYDFEREIKEIKLGGRETFTISELLDICRRKTYGCPAEEICVDVIYDYKEMLSGKIVINESKNMKIKEKRDELKEKKEKKAENERLEKKQASAFLEF